MTRGDTVVENRSYRTIKELERLDATIIAAYRQRYADKPSRAEYEIRRYEKLMAAFRQRVERHPPASQPELRHLRYVARYGRGWSAAYAEKRLQEIEGGVKPMPP